jgi:hypothetical protein
LGGVFSGDAAGVECGAGFSQYDHFPASVFDRSAGGGKSGAPSSDNDKSRFKVFGSHGNAPLSKSVGVA